nr:hypothetical protein Cry52Nrm3_p143 [Cryptomonas curvata]
MFRINISLKIKVFLFFLTVIFKNKLIKIEMKISSKAKKIHLYKNFESRLSLFFNFLLMKKLLLMFSLVFSNGENLINNFKLKNYRLISEKTLFLLRTIFKNFLNSFVKNIKINNIINIRNDIDIHDIITNINFSDLFISVEEIFFFRKLKFLNLKTNLYIMKKCKSIQPKQHLIKFSLLKIKEKKKNNFYSGLRFFDLLRYKYTYRLKYINGN